MNNVCAPHPPHAEAHLRARTTPSPIAIAPLHRSGDLSQASSIDNDANDSGASGRVSVEGHVPTHLHCESIHLPGGVSQQPHQKPHRAFSHVRGCAGQGEKKRKKMRVLTRRIQLGIPI